MEVKKEQIVRGVANYMRNEVIKGISSNNFQFILYTIAASMEVNSETINKFLENPMVKVALVEKNGMYDIDKAKMVLEDTLKNSGGFTITIPSVKFILPEEQEIKFVSSDVATLCDYIRKAA